MSVNSLLEKIAQLPENMKQQLNAYIDSLLEKAHKQASEQHTENGKPKEYYQSIVKKGGDMSYIDDPVSWQKEIREDRI